MNLAGLALGLLALVGVAAGRAPAEVPLNGALVAGSQVPRGNPTIGIHANPQAAEPLPAAVFGIERLWDTGAIWCRMNPAPGVWDFTPLNSQLDDAAQRGASATVVVLGLPPAHAVTGTPNAGEAGWLCPQPGFASLLPSDAAWIDYVQRTVQQVEQWRSTHPDVAVHFQVWNEPGVRWFLGADQRADRLVELSVQARQVVKAAMPQVLLISPSIVRNRTPERRQWQAEFVQAAKQWTAARQQVLFDVWAVHLYPVGSDLETLWLDYGRSLDDVLTTIDAGRTAGDQVWITEVNANIAFTGPPSSLLPEADQAQFVQRVSADTAARGIPVTIWYRWAYDPLQQGSGQIVFTPQTLAFQALPVPPQG